MTTTGLVSERERVRAFLCRGDWFSHLPDTLQTLLIDQGSVRHYERGEVVHRQASPAKGLFAVLSGQVCFSNQLNANREFILHLAGPGFWFGEAPLILGEETKSTATARTSVKILLVPAAKLQAILDKEPRFYRDFALLHARRYVMALTQLAEVAELTREDYLRRRLVDLVTMMSLDGLIDGHGSDSVAEDVNRQMVELALSQSDLAKMVGVSRQTVNGYLANLEAEGLIKVGFRSIRILNRERLLESL